MGAKSIKKIDAYEKAIKNAAIYCRVSSGCYKTAAMGKLMSLFQCICETNQSNSKAEYDKVGDEIYRLRDEKQKVQLEIIGRDELKKRIADMNTFLREQPTAITEYDEPLVRRLIEKITVFEDRFTVEFKSGVTVDVNE